MINGLFDLEFRLRKLETGGDPLVQLNAIVPWEEFRPALEALRDKPRKSNAGRKPFDAVLMFKILILQSLYNLSDDQLEFQITDRLSFMRFLGLELDQAVPDAKKIWLFRDQLTQAGLARTLFEQFDAFLRQHGFASPADKETVEQSVRSLVEQEIAMEFQVFRQQVIFNQVQDRGRLGGVLKGR